MHWNRIVGRRVVLTFIGITGATLANTRGVFGAEEIYTQVPVVAPSKVANAPGPEGTPVSPSKVSVLDDGESPSWIWGADDNQRYYLRQTFKVASPTVARFRATCDNQFTLFLNGQEVARSSEWQSPVQGDLTKNLREGENVLLAEVTNEGGPAGFIFKLALTTTDGKTRHVVTDKNWQASLTRDGKESRPARRVARLGEGAWGNVFSQTAGAPQAGNVFNLLPGFQVEKIFTVPQAKLGSWVCITFDNKGRLIASDQGNKGLCRITPAPIGSKEPTKVEHLDAKISGAQGMLYAFGSLYVSVNGGPGSGLYRLRDTKGTDQFDEVVKLKTFQGGGEHGPHGLRLSRDGKSILVMSGNHTLPPEKFNSSRLPSNWSEDLLLPRQWDANGHARGILAPGGWVARTDPEGKTWEIVSIGYRNAYDIALNADGELFSYDSDMEWDMGMPWYRPTRVTHVTDGSEFGWRSGTGVWPAYYVDSLPPLLDIGPGSPVGIEFGYGTKFPAKYQKALFICDWTFGTMYALHLTPSGSTYKAVKEEFVSRTPLPLTDLAVGPDGALYFAIGGRGIASDLFRVTYVGKEPTAPVDAKDAEGAELRELRRQIEAYHQTDVDPGKAVAFVYPHLSHADRFIRYAARVALEFQKPSAWQDRVLAETSPEALITGAVALARQGSPSLRNDLLAALDRLNWTSLTDNQQLELLRVYQLVLIRMGELDPAAKSRLIKKFDPLFPSASDDKNRELCQLLVFLQSPTAADKTIPLMQKESKPVEDATAAALLARNRGYAGPITKMQANAPDLQKLHYAFVLRNLKEGWKLEQKKFYFRWLNEARQKSGGASFQGFINNMEKDAFDNATDADRLAIEAAGIRKPFKVPALPQPQGPGRDWNMQSLLALESKLTKRNFANGKKMYAATRCIICHRYNGEGGATGPDLTQLAGRFSLKDLCESLVEPSKVISDQYKASLVTTASGKLYTGRIVSETKDTLILVIDPEDSTKVVEVKKKDVEETKASPTSLMPDGLLKTLNENEVLDLLAYLLSRADPNHAMFR